MSTTNFSSSCGGIVLIVSNIVDEIDKIVDLGKENKVEYVFIEDELLFENIVDIIGCVFIVDDFIYGLVVYITVDDFLVGMVEYIVVEVVTFGVKEGTSVSLIYI